VADTPVADPGDSGCDAVAGRAFCGALVRPQVESPPCDAGRQSGRDLRLV